MEIVISGAGGADWGTLKIELRLSKTALETPFVDVVRVHRYEKHGIAHALALSRIYICGGIPNVKSSRILAYTSYPAYAFAATCNNLFIWCRMSSKKTLEQMKFTEKSDIEKQRTTQQLLR